METSGPAKPKPKANLKAPTIFRRGVVLILLPALLAGMALACLSFVWMETDKLSRLEQHESEITVEFGSWFSTFGAYGYDFIHSTFEVSRESDSRAKARRDEFRQALQRLKDEFKGSNQEAALDLIEAKQTEMEKLADSIFGSVKREEFHSDIQRFRAYAVLMRKFGQLPGDLEAVQSKQFAQLTKTREKSMALRRLLSILLIGGFLVSSSLGLWLIYSFARDLAGRLRILSRRTVSLASARVPTEELGGADELNYLDRALVKASQEIKQASENRTSMKRVIAHDMRSPLMAAEVYAVILQDKFTESASQKAKTTCSELCQKLTAVVNTVSDLLTAKKLEGQDESTESEDNQTPNKARSSGIFRTCLLIGIIPLIFQGTTFVGLQTLIARSEQIEKLERRQVDRAANFQKLLMSHFRCYYATAFYISRKNPEYAREARDNLKSCQSLFKELYNGAKGEDKKLIAAASPITDQEVAFIEKATRTGENGNEKTIGTVKVPEPPATAYPSVSDSPEEPGNQQMSMLPKLAEQALITNTKMTGIVKDEIRQLDAVRTEGETARKLISALIYISLVADLLVAALLFRLFSVSIVNRLSRMMKEAKRLSEGKPAENSDADDGAFAGAGDRNRDRDKHSTANEGNDEITAIESAIRQAGLDLEEARLKRLDIMDTVVEKIRKPIIEVEALAKTLIEGEAKTESESVESMLSNLGRVKNLIDDLLLVETQVTASSPTLVLKKTRSSVKTIIEEAIEATKSLADRKNITLIAVDNIGAVDASGPGEIEIVADRARLVEALINYIDNAVKFSPQASSIEVGASKESATVDIFVRDQGSGMTKEVLAKVFEENYQSKETQAKSGFGIGLYSCKLIAEAHGGKAYAESELGQGSTFHLTIPI